MLNMIKDISITLAEMMIIFVILAVVHVPIIFWILYAVYIFTACISIYDRIVEYIRYERIE